MFFAIKIVSIIFVVLIIGGWIHGAGTNVTTVITNGSQQFWFNGAPTVIVYNADQRFWFNGAPNVGSIQ